MGKIVDLYAFNTVRKENKEILELGSDNVIKLSKDEAKEFLRNILLMK